MLGIQSTFFNHETEALRMSAGLSRTLMVEWPQIEVFATKTLGVECRRVLKSLSVLP